MAGQRNSAVSWLPRSAGSRARRPGAGGKRLVGPLPAEMKESSRRISALIAAVKSYSRMDRASTQRTDVTESLESTLVMLSHKLGDGLTLVRDYGTGIPLIKAHVGEQTRFGPTSSTTPSKRWTAKVCSDCPPAPSRRMSSSTSATPARECHRGGLPPSAMAALLPSIRDQAGQYSGSGFPSACRAHQYRLPCPPPCQSGCSATATRPDRMLCIAAAGEERPLLPP